MAEPPEIEIFRYRYRQGLIDDIVRYKTAGTLPPGLSRPQQAHWRATYDHPQFRAAAGKLYYGDIEIVSPERARQILYDLYMDPATGFKGRDKLFFYTKSRYNISRRYIADFLSTLEVHQLTVVKPRVPVVKPIVAKRPYERWQIDLVDMSNLARTNRGTHFLLTVIDVFSKFAYVRPLRNKEAETTRTALHDILNHDNAPRIIQSDNGSEFLDLRLPAGVKHIFSQPHTPQSQGQIERFNGTFKRMIFKYMTQKGEKKYIDQLQQLVSNYNNTYHCTTKKTPVELHRRVLPVMVNTLVHNNIARAAANRGVEKTFERLTRGDKVRISIKTTQEYKSSTFPKKSYYPQWSTQLFTVHSSGAGTGPKTVITLTNGKRYFRQDLLKVDEARMIRTERRPAFEAVPHHFVPPPAAVAERAAAPPRVIRAPARYRD